MVPKNDAKFINCMHISSNAQSRAGAILSCTESPEEEGLTQPLNSSVEVSQEFELHIGKGCWITRTVIFCSSNTAFSLR